MIHNPTKNLLNACALAAAAALCSFQTLASPYASGITNNNGTIEFVMNEDGGTVDVVFEDNTTNSLGVLPKGPASFPLGSHTSYRIMAFKAGNGVPALISDDAYTNSVWNSPRGVAVNSNPKMGHLFGRIYTDNSAAGGTIGTTYKGKGIYAMKADQTDAIGQGTNAMGTALFAGSGADGPYRIRVAPNNKLIVGDWSTAAAAQWLFDADLGSSSLLLGPVGQVEGQNAGVHGDMFGTAMITGSLEEGNMVLWTADGRLPAPASALLGPGTIAGAYNCVFRYDIGSGPLPWENSPNYAYTVGLDNIQGLRVEMTLGKDGKIIAGFGRANYSNGNIQILDPTGTELLYDSLNLDTGVDPWNGTRGAGSAVGMYGGVRVSPDGRFLASADLQNGLTIANLTNGIPDDGSIFAIQNPVNTGTAANPGSRGIDWDAANNIYVISGTQARLRIYSLGITSTCISSNDWTGTNGSFALIVPDISATVLATRDASQNYTNNTTNPGAPIPGLFKISLDKSTLTEPVVVTFNRGGTATYPANYTMLDNYTNAAGVAFFTNRVIFPAGASPSGNWSADVQIIATTNPVSGPTLNVSLGIVGGGNYVAGTPGTATMALLNTGPQVLVLTATTPALFRSFYRGVANDFARFQITRWGDTNGPLNSPGNINPLALTVTNVTYFGTATYPEDYTAQAQAFIQGQLPQDGSSALVIQPGQVAVSGIVGNPVPHTDLSLVPTNLTVILNLTNAVAGSASTNLLSQEGYPYQVNTTTVALTLVDNAVGPEPGLAWSNPMTNATDSVNWTLTYASTTLGGTTNTVLPVVIPNYVNGVSSIPGGGSNDFDVRFGHEIALDGVPPSPTMASNGWTTALRMTVNKNGTLTPAGVNVYPQGQSFSGNYSLKFDMYLSMWSVALNNPGVNAAYPREFALFGINHYGTNCNWRTLTVPAVPVGTGNGTTNADGVWFAVGAGYGSASPADFDMFTSPALPNSGITADITSRTAASQAGVFKHPPFDIINPNNAGGQPINKWVNVNVEVRGQTNCALFINNTEILRWDLTDLPGTTSLAPYTSGTIMLGYLDPVLNETDNSAFAYFSNVRVVDLGPNIQTQPTSLIVSRGADVSFTSTANLAEDPITAVWYRGTTTAPTVALQTNTASATNISTTLSLANVQTGTNYMVVFTDASGSVTSRVASLEVMQGPVDTSVAIGSAPFRLRALPNGPAAPTAYRWRKDGVLIANGAKYAGVTAADLWITNVQPADAGLYTVSVTNIAGYVIPQSHLSVVGALTPAAQTNLWGSTASFTVPAYGSGTISYQWKRGGVSLSDGGNISGANSDTLTIAGVTGPDAGSFTAGVTNGTAGRLSSVGVLTVVTPPPTFGLISIAGGNVTLPFTSTNPYDTTNAFLLQSSPVVEGPYTNTPAIVSSNGVFEITIPDAGGNMFYRLRHVD